MIMFYDFYRPVSYPIKKLLDESNTTWYRPAYILIDRLYTRGTGTRIVRGSTEYLTKKEADQAVHNFFNRNS